MRKQRSTYKTDYQFSAGDDWFSINIPKWKEMLKALKNKPCNLLEIGTYEGRAAFWLADHILNHPASKLICIDPWTIDKNWDRQGEKHWLANWMKCPRQKQVTGLKEYSQNAIPKLPFKFDFVYIDGSHEARDCMTDWVHVWNVTKPGSLICFDDYGWMDQSVRIGPAPAIDAVLGWWGDLIEVLFKDYQVWIKRIH